MQPTEALIQNDVLTSCTEQMCVALAIKGSIHDHSPFTPRAKQRYVHAEIFMEWARNLITCISLFFQLLETMLCAKRRCKFQDSSSKFPTA